MNENGKNPAAGLAWLALAAVAICIVASRREPGYKWEGITYEAYRQQIAETEFELAGESAVSVLSVVDAESGEPVRGAHVTEERQWGRDYFSIGRTDPNGKVLLPMTGTRRLLIQHAGYNHAYAEGGVGSRTAKMRRTDFGFM